MSNIVDSLRQRYPHIHPLVFARSLERSNSQGELFDILEETPQDTPFIWDEEQRRWVVTNDILQSHLQSPTD